MDIGHLLGRVQICARKDDSVVMLQTAAKSSAHTVTHQDQAVSAFYGSNLLPGTRGALEAITRPITIVKFNQKYQIWHRHQSQLGD